MMKTVLKYGAGIAAALAVVTLLVIHVIGIEYGWARWFLMLAPVPVLFISLLMGINEQKKFYYQNEINYSQALFSGILISAFGTVLLLMFNIIYHSLNKNFADEVIAVILPEMKNLSYSEEQQKEYITQIRNTYTLQGQVSSAFMMLITGIVFSAILAAFIRNKDTFTQVFKK
ncbi:MAG: DUF4199 domain-containing protein [Cytophagaceae bacterium]|nr:DUF4199 domain-containing protein [Cytophagaceae bacterium]MDW8455998.1 DUF4199 domain-containing protein [Cytophagaceae bacterium]